MKTQVENSLVLTFYDLKRLYVEHRMFLAGFSVFVAFCTVAICLLQPLTYKSEALLKVGQFQGQINSKMKEFFPSSTLHAGTNSAIAILQSNTLLREIVEEQGLQVKCFIEPWLVRVWRQLKGNLLAQWEIPSSEEEAFSFSNVHFSNEKLLKWGIRFNELREWEVFDSNKISLGKALVGSKMTLGPGTLTLTQIPKTAKPHVVYPLKISPWIKEVRRLRETLKITPFKIDKTIVALEWKAPTRLRGKEVLNGLMEHYQALLNKESDITLASQLGELYEQRDTVIGQYKEALLEHRRYLQHSVDSGFIGYAQEVESLSLPKNGCSLKLFDIDLELNRLSRSKEGALPLNEERNVSGLNLQTVAGLLGEYTSQKNQLESQLQELIFLQTQLQSPDFELSTLGCVFEDGVTKELVNKASAIALQLKDSNNRSVSEQERLKEALETQKKFLSQYLIQMVDLKQRKFHLLNEKILELKSTSSQLLQSEQKLLQGKLQEINADMKGLPDKWHQEALLTLKQEQASTLLTGISHAIESLLLGKQSFQSNSRPLDETFVSYLPQPPFLIFSFIIALFLAFISGYGCVFFKTLIRGFPVSDPMLRALGFPVGGSLDEIDSLRHVVQELFIPHKGPLLAVCLGGKHSNYSCALAELLSKRELKTLVIHSPWSQTTQFEIPPIESRATHDFLPLKGVHEVETLCSSQFKHLLSQYKTTYDVILLYTEADPAKVEGRMLLEGADVVLITVQNETKEKLSVYYDWSEKKQQGKALFLYEPIPKWPTFEVIWVYARN